MTTEELHHLNVERRRELADIIRERITRGDEVIHVLYEPGDMTCYDLVLARVDARPGVGATYFRPDMLRSPHFPTTETRWLLAWPGFPAMTVDLSPGHYTDPSYVGEKMKMAPGSVAIIAELLCMVTECDETMLEGLRQTYPATPFRADAATAS